MPLPADRQALVEERQGALVLTTVERRGTEVAHGNTEEAGVVQLAGKLRRLRVECCRLIQVLGDERSEVDAEGPGACGVCLRRKSKKLVRRRATSLDVPLP